MKYLVLCLLLFSCANKLTKKGPTRAFEESFYKFSKEKFKIYKRTCGKLKDPRECQVIEYDLDKIWGQLQGNWVIIDRKYVF